MDYTLSVSLVQDMEFMLPGVNQGDPRGRRRQDTKPLIITSQFWIGCPKLLLAFTEETEIFLYSCIRYTCIFCFFLIIANVLVASWRVLKKVNVFRAVIYVSSDNMQLIILFLKSAWLLQVAQNRLPFRLAASSFKPSTLQRNPTFIKFKDNSDME